MDAVNLQLLIEGMSQPLAICQPDGTISSYNQAFVKSRGWDSDDDAENVLPLFDQMLPKTDAVKASEAVQQTYSEMLVLRREVVNEDEVHVVWLHIRPVALGDQMFSVLSEESMLITKEKLEKAINSGKIGAENEGPASISMLSQEVRPRVLLVDDNQVNVLVAAEMLELEGIQYDVAYSGFEALDHIASNDYDIVFMDINMPRMDGIETTRKIREKERADGDVHRSYVIALTAYNLIDGSTDVSNTDFDEYIRKPITLNQMQHVLNQWISSQRNKIGLSRQEPGQMDIDYHLDIAAIESLQTLLKDKLDGLLVMFIEETDRYCQLMREASERGDVNTVYDIAHSAKSNAAYFGAKALESIAIDIEQQAKRDQGQVPELVDRFVGEFEQVRRAYAVLREKQASAA